MSKPDKRLETEDHFMMSYAKFQKSVLFKRLDKKFSLKPYYERYNGARKLAFVASYAFNALSAITASSAVYFFMNPYIENPVGSITITALFMVLLELAKRTSASAFLVNVFQFRRYPLGLSGVAVGLVLLSILFSYKGSRDLIFELADPPLMVSMDSFTEKYRKEIAQIDEQIGEARKTTYKGITTRTSQATIDKLTDQRKLLQDRIFQVENDIRQENKIAKAGHIGKTQSRAYSFAFFTLLCELLFLLCLGYMEYYDFRSFGEFAENPFGEEDKTALGQKPDGQKLQEGLQLFIKNEMGKQLKTVTEILQLQLQERAGHNRRLLQERNDKKTKAQKPDGELHPTKNPVAMQSGKLQRQLQQTETALQNATVTNPALQEIETHRTTPVQVSGNGNAQYQQLQSEKETFQTKVPKQEAIASTIKRVGEVEPTEITNLKEAIRKTQRKIRLAKHRIKEKIGKAETSEHNLKVAEAEMEQLNLRLTKLTTNS